MSYQLLDFGQGQRLEQWGEFRLIRPDPTAEGAHRSETEWNAADAIYEGEKGKGQWITKRAMPPQWNVSWDDITMIVKLAPYKHTGVFPEQQANWKWMKEISKDRRLNVLNLFAYTGAATMALAKDGHFVTHVDSSKPAIAWAKENQILNNIPTDRIRWILDDAAEFAAREVKRGKTYDAIVLDPPAFGHSPTGKTWRVERDLAPLLEDCAKLLSASPAFLLLNGYAQHDTPESFKRLLTGILRTQNAHRDVTIEAAELYLETHDHRKLSTGTFARCRF